MNELAATEIDLRSTAPVVQRALEGVEEAWLYSLPLNVRFRGVTHREGILLRGEYGWGEAAPFTEYSPAEASLWLRSAVASATLPPPRRVRGDVAVNVTIPVVSPQDAVARVRASGGCSTAKVKVADPRSSLLEDCARVEAVASALRDEVGGAARVRVDVNGAWDVDFAVRAIAELDRAAAGVGGLEYVEQPCARVEDLALLRRRCSVRIAADESIRRSDDPWRVAQLAAADVAVVKIAPLGGIERALRIGAETGLDVVVSSALESSVGLGAGVQAAAALEDAPFASGLATAQLLATDVSSVSLLPVGGRIRVGDVRPDRVYSAQPLAADRVAWWGAHLTAMAEFIAAEG